MTEQEKIELIDHIKSVIAQYESDSYKFPLSEKAYRIALAALTAEPLAYVFKHPEGKLFWSITAESNKDHHQVVPVFASVFDAKEVHHEG